MLTPFPRSCNANVTQQLNPDDPLCYSNRGRLFYQQGQWAAAVADYTKAIALSPNDASFHNNRGYAYDKLGNLDAAIYDLTMAVELRPKALYQKKLAKLRGRNSHYSMS
jgi:Flp pilus assembly protein TadD